MKNKLSKNIVFIYFIIISVYIIINNIWFQDILYFFKERVKIEQIVYGSDKNKNGVDDPKDIILGARNEVLKKVNYKSVYYSGGFPPENEGVCTDLVWRALKNAGYDLKTLIDKDIKENPLLYKDSVNKPDPNIDFRRVKNQHAFFKRKAEELTMEVVPFDKDNLTKWQGGDIVILVNTEHIAIISDKRRKNGIPYVIHNYWPHPKEEDLLLKWYENDRMVGHYRYYE